MPPTKIDQGTIIILDIGKNVSTAEGKDEKTFFEKAKEFTTRIIERKIMSQAKHYVGIILLGSIKTKNEMAVQYDGSYRNIELLAELQTPSWKMIRELPEAPTSKTHGNWFDALIVAADHFKNGISEVKMSSKKVILITNFESSGKIKEANVEMALDGFKLEGFEVDVIGLDIYDDIHKSENIKIARRFVETTDGATATFEYAMRYLLFHRKKATNAVPWNVDLNIGPNVKIPVSTYIRLKDEPVVKKWIKAIKDPVTSMASTSDYIATKKIHVNTENKTVLASSETIKGHHYGEEIIPFTKCDQSMLYQSGDKSLSIYGFTHASNVTWQNLNGDGMSYVFGRKGDNKAQHALRCFVECLHELDLVAIVRKVHNKGNAPKMFALFPVFDPDNLICLSMIGICYKEDVKNMAFPSTNLKKYSCTDEQVNAFKDLIKAMDLTKAYDETYDESEAFPIAETVNPFAQYMLDCIAFRAMNPDKPIPQPRDDIMMLFKQPPLIEKKSREPLEKIKKLFTLTKVEQKSKKKNPLQIDTDNIKQLPKVETNGTNDMPKVQLPVTNKIDVSVIGTADPVKDFKILTEKGKTMPELCQQLTEAIENLLYFNLGGTYNKAVDTMMFFRKECVNIDPSFYNTWLQKFKIELNNRSRNDILQLIVEKKLDYILKNENKLSTYDTENSHDESQQYEYDTIPDSTNLTIGSEVNDLFDEM